MCRTDGKLRKILHLASSCFSVRLAKTIERYLSVHGAATGRELLDFAVNEGFRFPSLAAFDMRLSRLVRSGFLVRLGRGVFALNLNRYEREILDLMYRLCEEGEVEGGDEP